jgi:hypothetical protein
VGISDENIMRTKSKPIRYQLGWHTWFAWCPVKLYLYSDDGLKVKYTRWVWLEEIQRKWSSNWASGWWEYRPFYE